MQHQKRIVAEGEPTKMECPEKELIYAVINRAIIDAGSQERINLAWEAIDFLFSDRINPYVELLDMDPDTFKSGLINQMRSYRYKGERGDINKRGFSVNYERFIRKPFMCTVPRDLLYGDGT